MFGSAVAETWAGFNECGYVMLEMIHDDNELGERQDVACSGATQEARRRAWRPCGTRKWHDRRERTIELVQAMQDPMKIVIDAYNDCYKRFTPCPAFVAITLGPETRRREHRARLYAGLGSLHTLTRLQP